MPQLFKKNEHGAVFPAPFGGYRQPKFMLGVTHKQENRWHLWQEAAGLNPRHWHQLRHTCATSLGAGWWSDSGERWGLEDIAQLLGHLSTATTRRYRHLIDTAISEIAARTSGLDVNWSTNSPRTTDASKTRGPEDATRPSSTGRTRKSPSRWPDRT
jgi:integrase